MGARRTGQNKIFVFVFRFKTTKSYKSNDFTLGKLVYSKHLSRVDQVINKQFQFFPNTKKMSETRRPLLSRHESCEDQEEVDEIVLVTIRQTFWNCNCVCVIFIQIYKFINFCKLFKGYFSLKKDNLNLHQHKSIHFI